MQKEIKNLIKRTVGGGEHKDWFMELEEGIQQMIEEARKSERERVLKENNTYENN